MNFLAHCALASAHPHYIVGGFLGDFVKGSVPEDLPAGIRTGVRLHRRIDAFSSTQPDIRASVARLPAECRRLGPVFIDLVADHFLARHFANAHGLVLGDFAALTYQTLAEHEAYLPMAALRFSTFMREHDLLTQYVDLDPVERAFRRIARRLRRDDAVAESMSALRAHYVELEQDFFRYYPALRAHASHWLAENS